MEYLSPQALYQQAIEEGFITDEAQQQAVDLLESCYQALHQPAVRHCPIPGVYLWGPVGRGKTWLMDQFYRCLRVPARRQHFHHFMQWVHRRLFQLTGTAEPLTVLAHELSEEVRVLCFDELFVNDIGDVMILGGLFQAMFEYGVVVVATSNQPPDQLYAQGHNRERFLPAIKAIEHHMRILGIDGGQDHRLHPGATQQRYWLSEPGRASVLEDVFTSLTKGSPWSAQPVGIGRRQIEAVRHAGSVIWCRYSDLCDQPLSALDFIGLCDRFSVILISEVPRLSGEQKPGRIARGTEDGVEQVAAGDRELPMLALHDDGVRRFIALVDECYDRRVPLYIEAEVPLDELYTQGYLSFAFRRTLSRLHEMQLKRFCLTG